MRLSVTDLTVGHDGAPAVSAISFEVGDGGVTTLLGPNGAGKTTILRTLARQLRPISGRVIMDGRDAGSLTPSEFSRRVAVLSTGFKATELLTCGDVVESGRHPYTGRLGILGENDKRAVREAMARTDCLDLALRDFMKTSDGQKQRVLLARALAQEPSLILADEPSSHLDARYTYETLKALAGLAGEGMSVVMSLHQVDLAAKVSDQVICVKDGRVFRQGSPRQVLGRDAVRDLFGLDEDGFRFIFGEEAFPAEASAGSP